MTDQGPPLVDASSSEAAAADLRALGLKVGSEIDSLRVGLGLDEDGDILPTGEVVLVSDRERTVAVRLPRTTDLFRGNRRPAPFGSSPPPEYVPVFYAIECAAYDFYELGGEKIQDKEFERAYNDLRRRPDGDGQHPVVPHLRAAIRLYMALHDLSEGEYEAVLRRLTRSARTFAMGYTSVNYYTTALCPLARAGGNGNGPA